MSALLSTRELSRPPAAALGISCEPHAVSRKQILPSPTTDGPLADQEHTTVGDGDVDLTVDSGAITPAGSSQHIPRTHAVLREQKLGFSISPGVRGFNAIEWVASAQARAFMTRPLRRWCGKVCMGIVSRLLFNNADPLVMKTSSPAVAERRPMQPEPTSRPRRTA
jgi:hypothetical protein